MSTPLLQEPFSDITYAGQPLFDQNAFDRARASEDPNHVGHDTGNAVDIERVAQKDTSTREVRRRRPKEDDDTDDERPNKTHSRRRSGTNSMWLWLLLVVGVVLLVVLALIAALGGGGSAF